MTDDRLLDDDAWEDALACPDNGDATDSLRADRAVRIERIAALEAEVEDLGAKLNEYIDKTRDAEADLAALRVAVDAHLYASTPTKGIQLHAPGDQARTLRALRAARDGTTTEKTDD